MRWRFGRSEDVAWDAFGGVGGFFDTWLTMMFEPGRVAARLPPRFSMVRAAVFSAVNYVGASIVLVLLAMADNRSLAIPAARLSLFGVAVGIVCETLIAMWLAVIVRPTFAETPYRLWRGLMHYFSGAFATSGLAIAIVFWLTPLAFGTILHFFAFLPSIVAFIIMPIWWIAALSRAVDERSGDGLRPLLGQFGAIVIVGLGAVVASVAFIRLRGWF